MAQFSRAAYLAAQNEKLEAQPTTMVKLPSGMEFELRRPNMSAFTKNGRLPDALLKIGLDQWQKKGIASPALAMAELAADEQLKILIFMRDIVRDACVHPRIVLADPADDEITPQEITEADFDFIYLWASGAEGGEAASAAGFRQKRRGAARARKNR